MYWKQIWITSVADDRSLILLLHDATQQVSVPCRLGFHHITIPSDICNVANDGRICDLASPKYGYIKAAVYRCYKFKNHSRQLFDRTSHIP
jgi:hypothetical protein